MYRIIIALLLISSLIADNSIYKVDLFKYAEIVSAATNQNILIDNKVPAKEISFYAPAKLKISDYIQTFKDLLRDCNLRLIKRKNYYYVTLPIRPDKSLHSYQFQNLNVSEVRFINRIFPDIKFQYFVISNMIFYNTDVRTHKAIQRICKSLDLSYRSKDIQLTIFVTDLQKLRNKGIKYEQFGIDFTGFMTLTQNGLNFKTLDAFKFKGYLDLLQKKKIVEVLQNPVIHLTDEKKTSFNVVKNLPVITSITQVNENKVTSQQQIEYRDIGLKIEIKPNIFKDYVFLDLNLISETIDTLSDTPITNKINYENSFKLTSKQSILLSGLNISQTNIEKYKIPILGDLPYINPLFKSTTKETKNQVLSILIEIIN